MVDIIKGIKMAFEKCSEYVSTIDTVYYHFPGSKECLICVLLNDGTGNIKIFELLKYLPYLNF